MKRIIETLLFCGLFGLVFLSGIVLGRFFFPIEKQTFSERKDICNKKGGDYSYYEYKEFNTTEEKCRLTNNNIDF